MNIQLTSEDLTRIDAVIKCPRWTIFWNEVTFMAFRVNSEQIFGYQLGHRNHSSGS